MTSLNAAVSLPTTILYPRRTGLNSTHLDRHSHKHPKRLIRIQIFHAYIYGTAFWYALRGLCRVYDPLMVAACN